MSSSAGRSNFRSESDRNPGHSMNGGRRRSGSVSLAPKCRLVSLRGLSTGKRRVLSGVRRGVLADKLVVTADNPELAVTADNPELAVTADNPELAAIPVGVDTPAESRTKSMGGKSGTGKVWGVQIGFEICPGIAVRCGVRPHRPVVYHI